MFLDIFFLHLLSGKKKNRPKTKLSMFNSTQQPLDCAHVVGKSFQLSVPPVHRLQNGGDTLIPSVANF